MLVPDKSRKGMFAAKMTIVHVVLAVRILKQVCESLKGACLAERWLSAGTLFAEGRVNSGNRKMEELKKKIKRTIKDRRLKL